VKSHTLSALNTLVSEAIDVVVFAERTPAGPRVTEIIAVEDLAGGVEAAQFTATEVFRRGPDGGLRWSGQMPTRLRDPLATAGYDLIALLDDGSPR